MPPEGIELSSFAGALPTAQQDTLIQWRSEGGGAGGASAPGRRPEGGAKILARIFFLNLYKEKL